MFSGLLESAIYLAFIIDENTNITRKNGLSTLTQTARRHVRRKIQGHQANASSFLKTIAVFVSQSGEATFKPRFRG